ncbi:hypothetical protein [Streptomyces sp. NPDC051636]|uniref:hypothetical protein n=1 Tax=Streptomyces sp. NPDC051636 TaxID=3365663 RepID=UPI0037952162
MTNHDVAVPEVEVARYAAPRVSVSPVTQVIWPEPLDKRSMPGQYQKVLLDTRTGELRFHENTRHLEPWNPAWKATNDVPRETWNRWYPGTGFAHNGPHMWFGPVPQLLSWTVDSGVEELPYLDIAAANALLHELTPVAQALMDGLFDGGGDLDWSAASARAGRNIRRLVSETTDRRWNSQTGTLNTAAWPLVRSPPPPRKEPGRPAEAPSASRTKRASPGGRPKDAPGAGAAAHRS